MEDEYESFAAGISDQEEQEEAPVVLNARGKPKGKPGRPKKSEVAEVVVRIKELDLNSIPPMSPEDHKNGVKLVVIGKAGCHAAGTQVMMYDGTCKAVETIEEGELVMGDDGTPRTVLQLCRGEEEMFEIQPSYGESYIVNLKHKLVLRSTVDSSVDMPTIEEYLTKSEEYKQTHQVFKASRIETWPQVDTLCDPYEYGYSLKDAWRTEKCIPMCYKKNSKEVRLAVLAGILDALGEDNEYTIPLLFERVQQFAHDIVFIARSLGFTATYQPEKQRVYIGTKGIQQIPCKKPRNGCVVDEETSSFFTIKPLGVDKYYGFTLDANNLYLLKSFDVVRNTGKSTVIQALLASKAHLIPAIQVFSGTEDSNGSYSKVCPPLFVYDGLDINALIAFKNRQYIANKNIHENAWACQVIDDCTDDPKQLRHPVIQAYYKNGRHWHMFHILSLQYSLDILPSIRSNIDYTFIMKENSKKNRKKLYENYCHSSVESFEDFNTLMDALTNDFSSLVIKNQGSSNKLEDNIFYFKADPNAISPTWRFGHTTCWQFSNERYDEDYIKPIIK